MREDGTCDDDDDDVVRPRDDRMWTSCPGDMVWRSIRMDLS